MTFIQVLMDITILEQKSVRFRQNTCLFVGFYKGDSIIEKGTVLSLVNASL